MSHLILKSNGSNFLSAAGSTSGPIVLGSIIDNSCDVWQETCGSRGSCWIYRKYDLEVSVLLWWLGTKLFGVVMLLIASKLYKAPKDEDLEPQTTNGGNKNGNFNSVFVVTDIDISINETKHGFSTKL